MKQYLNIVIGLVSGIACIAFADSAVVDFDQGLVFPRQLGGLKYAEMEQYESTMFGYSVFYGNKRNIYAEVTIFDMGHTDIPMGHTGEGVKQVFQNVEHNLKVRKKRKEIVGIQRCATNTVPEAGSLQFHSYTYQYRENQRGGRQRLQAVYVTGYKDKYVQLSLRFPLEENERAKSIADQMINQLIDIVSAEHDEKKLLIAACEAFIQDPSSYRGRVAAQRVLAAVQAMENPQVYPNLFPWTESPEPPPNSNLLTTAYFAGVIKTIHSKEVDSDGAKEGFISMLEAYKNMLKRRQITSIPKLDEWVGAPDKAVLFEQLLIVP